MSREKKQNFPETTNYRQVAAKIENTINTSAPVLNFEYHNLTPPLVTQLRFQAPSLAHLKILDLTSAITKINEGEFVKFFGIFKHYSSLETLSLKANILTTRILTVLVEFCQTTKTLKKLNFRACTSNNANLWISCLNSVKLESLDIRKTNVGDKIREYTNLKHLSEFKISHCSELEPLLTKFKTELFKLETLYLEHLGLNNIKSISELIRQNVNLKRLSLLGNSLTEVDLNELFLFLREINSPLRCLNLSYQCDTDVCEIFIPYVSVNQKCALVNLTDLIIYNNGNGLIINLPIHITSFHCNPANVEINILASIMSYDYIDFGVTNILKLHQELKNTMLTLYMCLKYRRDKFDIAKCLLDQKILPYLYKKSVLMYLNK